MTKNKIEGSLTTRLLLEHATRFDFPAGERGLIRVDCNPSHQELWAVSEVWLVLRVLDERSTDAPDVLVERNEGYSWIRPKDLPGADWWIPNLEELREAVELAMEIAHGDRAVDEPAA